MDTEMYNAQGVQVNYEKLPPSPSVQSPPLAQKSDNKLTRRLSKLHLHSHSSPQLPTVQEIPSEQSPPAPPPLPQKSSKFLKIFKTQPSPDQQPPQMTFQQFCSQIPEHSSLLPPHPHLSSSSPQFYSHPPTSSSPHIFSHDSPSLSPQFPQSALQKSGIFNRRLSKLRTSSTSSPQFTSPQLSPQKSPKLSKKEKKHLSELYSSSPQLTLPESPEKLYQQETRKAEKEAKKEAKEAQRQERETKKKEEKEAKKKEGKEVKKEAKKLSQQPPQPHSEFSLAKSQDSVTNEPLCSELPQLPCGDLQAPMYVNESFYAKSPLLSQPPVYHNIQDANRSYKFTCIGDYCTYSDASGNVVYNFCTDPQLGCLKLTDPAGEKLATASARPMRLCINVISANQFRGAKYSRTNVTGAKRLEEEGPSGYAYDFVTRGNCWMWNSAKGGQAAMTFLNDTVYFYPTCTKIAEKAIALVHAYECTLKAKEEKKGKKVEKKEEKDEKKSYHRFII